MFSHAAQIQALLAREREEYAQWGRLARSAGGTAPLRADEPERLRSGAAAARQAQARAARRGSSAGTSAAA